MVLTKFSFISIIFFVNFSFGFSQIAPNKYVVYFSDKTNSEFSINLPNQFLTQRAIDRRVRQKISISDNDLPVNKNYIDSLQKFNLKILNQSKWLNCVTIYCNDLAVLDSISYISFVKTIKKISYNENQKINKFHDEEIIQKNITDIKSENILKYGESTNQITMLNGHKLHNLGFQGQGILIAITDAGYYKANETSAFDSLFDNNQIIAEKSFTNQISNVYEGDKHGAQVLSILAANKPNTIIGSAPKANYILLMSEDVNSEYRIEEYNWVSAAEFADSLGVDIINVSLGYNLFSDNQQDYSYANMDGKTAIITIASNIAASKGILVVSSAGNEGNNAWKYITAPADADSVFAVGAVEADGLRTALSSIGPTADGRTKPNIAAQGALTAYYSSSEYVAHGYGTSYSAPIISGLAACLWQKFPQITNFELMKYIEKSANQFNNPDNFLGYGLPDFDLANILLEDSFENNFICDDLIKLGPNPFVNSLNFDFYSKENQTIKIEIYDLMGRLQYQENKFLYFDSYNKITINDLSSLNSGIYFLKISSQNSVESTRKLIKVN